jgi:hypothetical protein
MREPFPFRKMIAVTAFAAAAVSLMAPAHADESTDPYIRDALVGQSSAPADEDRTTDGWLHSVVGERARKASSARLQGLADASNAARGAADPFIRDALIGQVPGTVGGTEPAPAMDLSDSDTDWVLLSGGLVLAFLMGIAGTLLVEYYRDMRHRTA